MKASKLSLILTFGFVILALNLIRMQILESKTYHRLSEKNRLRVVYLEAPRGRIFDRNGGVLASSRLCFNCSAIPREAKSHLSKSFQILGSVLEKDASELEKNFLKRKQGAFNTVLVAEDIPVLKAVMIEERLGELPGFMIETRPQREYPLGMSTAHLLGFIGPMRDDEKEFFEFYGYRAADWVGQEGIEKTYESYLRGRSGGIQMEVDNRGRFLRALGVKEPKEGLDIQLTVDGRLQSFVQELLKSQKGAVAVMQLEEGAILSINSSPSFDPNLFSSIKGRREVGRFLKDVEAPMMNRSLHGSYPPGSIFKIVTALAALEQRKITEMTPVTCPGYLLLGGNRFDCWQEAGHGEQTLRQAFAHSCNVFFYTLGLWAGVEGISEKAAELGFSKPTGIDLPGEKSGLVPSKDWKKKHRHEPWYEGETANLAIGQGYLQVTPLQCLLMIGAVATDGQILRPHLIDKIASLRVAERHARHLNVNARTWAVIKEGLVEVVRSDTGTGRLARVPNLSVAGKTGTAQSGQDKTHAWFVGFSPADKPKIALVVFLENGGRGGVSAARFGSTVFQWLKDARYL